MHARAADPDSGGMRPRQLYNRRSGPWRQVEGDAPSDIPWIKPLRGRPCSFGRGMLSVPDLSSAAVHRGIPAWSSLPLCKTTDAIDTRSQ